MRVDVKRRSREPESEPDVEDLGEDGALYSSPPWMHEGVEFDPSLHPQAKSFVYVIECLLDGKKYIGKKLLTRAKTMPPLKGKKRKRRSRVESNWREYWGSNEELQADVKRMGPDKFKRTVLRVCQTAAEASYYEAHHQFLSEVLLRPDDFYNRHIRVRVHTNHLRKISR